MSECKDLLKLPSISCFSLFQLLILQSNRMFVCLSETLSPLEKLDWFSSVLVLGWYLARKSDAQLDTLRKISCKFQLNQSSQLGWVVVTWYFYFQWLTDWQMSIFIRCTNRHLKKFQLNSFSRLEGVVVTRFDILLL